MRLSPTAPGIGKEVGATLGLLRELYMGLFNAPHVTGEAVKAAVFASALFEKLGFEVTVYMSEEAKIWKKNMLQINLLYLKMNI